MLLCQLNGGSGFSFLQKFGFRWLVWEHWLWFCCHCTNWFQIEGLDILGYDTVIGWVVPDVLQDHGAIIFRVRRFKKIAFGLLDPEGVGILCLWNIDKHTLCTTVPCSRRQTETSAAPLSEPPVILLSVSARAELLNASICCESTRRAVCTVRLGKIYDLPHCFGRT